MPPFSLVFHTEATVSIGLKNVFRVGASFPFYINIQTSVQQQQQLNKLFNFGFRLLFLGLQESVDVKFLNKVKTPSGRVCSLPAILLQELENGRILKALPANPRT